jgi:hypothetical protein
MSNRPTDRPTEGIDFYSILRESRTAPATATQDEPIRESRTAPAAATQGEPRDRFVKGSLADDKAIAIAQKVFTAIAIFFVLCFLHLVLERQLTPKIYTPIRVWLPTILWFVIVIPKRHPFALGWLGWLGTYAIAGATCGYLWLYLQQFVGNR